jgi:Tfp pilus assembly protein PilO
MELHTPRATMIIGVASLLLIAAVSWTVVIGPEMSRLSAVRTQIQDTRDQNALLQVQLARLVKQSKDLDAVRGTAEALAAKFPPTADQPALFEAVTEAAVDAGIGADGVTTLAPSPPVTGGEPTAGVPAQQPTKGGQLARQAVSISIEGSYQKTLRLLDNLEQMARAYLVTSVSLNGGAEDGFTTTLTGDMFVMPPLADPGDVDRETVPSAG